MVKGYIVVKHAHNDYSVIVQASGRIVAKCYEEIAAHQIETLLNFYQESLLTLDWCKWHTPKEMLAIMSEAMSSLSKKSPPSSTQRPPAPPALSTLPALPALPGIGSAKPLPALGPQLPTLG